MNDNIENLTRELTDTKEELVSFKKVNRDWMTKEEDKLVVASLTNRVNLIEGAYIPKAL